MRVVKAPEDRKEDILEAATDLFLTKGFDKTSVDDIVKSLKISKGLAYYYFKTKDDLIEDVVSRLSHEVSKPAIEIMKSDDEFYLKLFKSLTYFMAFANNFKGKFKSMISRDKNRVLVRFRDSILNNIMPYLAELATYGINNGYISNTDGVNSMIIIVSGSISCISLSANNPDFSYDNFMISTANTIEMSLGMKKGSITSYFEKV